MALFKKFISLPPLRSPESFEATYRDPWPLVKKWPLVYLQTTKKAPKSISVAQTDRHFITLKTKSEVKVKVTVTRKWYAILRHPKMHPHTKFGIPTSKNIGDMHRIQSGTDVRTVRLLYASKSSFGDIKKILEDKGQ